MNEVGLQKSFSDVSSEIKRHINDKVEEEEEEVKQVNCDCCGLEEECTPQYIDRIKNSYSGKWVCGLCAEVITEKLGKQFPAAGSVMEALEWHRGFCERFNSTTRLNPKLYFAYSMRDVAKRSSQNRKPNGSRGLKIARSSSYDPRIHN
ncbi:PREDICTED: uncharacterized protein LOC104803753 [Tarenaya hassleriana]|uniref:uncharacterized protein LOC104803753 n=1 Tax=Tarenaya hassleriana TaxID=28532 RepID=UPI00053C3FEF|nr:PREDICTED: uncharacterized protein LOC104803753 [Tarenaya hassleriana]